ncbi:glycosyltransferase [Ignavibacteria bacterium 4148-Me]|uniref:glycosyltransferase n=1 Tax=Rosettibacter primus TaxID=3111523 RepID=UPI00336BF700
MNLRVLHYVGYPLDYAHGGHKEQIFMTLKGLDELGVQNEWLHNENQDLSKKYDIVHFWTLPSDTIIKSIKTKLNVKLIWSTMLPSAGKRKKITEYFLKILIKSASNFNHPKIKILFPNYNVFDAIIVLNNLEKKHYENIWGVKENKIYVVPNGIDDIFFNSSEIKPLFFDGVLQIGAITPIKNSLEVAKCAKIAGTKIKFIGDFRLVDEKYKKAFLDEIDNRYTYFEGPIQDKRELIKHMKGCKGIIVPSKWEAYPLVVAEALALKQRVMLIDLPNLRTIYGDSVFYCHQPNHKKFIKELQEFVNNNITKSIDYKPLRWKDVAKIILGIYTKIL